MFDYPQETLSQLAEAVGDRGDIVAFIKTSSNSAYVVVNLSHKQEFVTWEVCTGMVSTFHGFYAPYDSASGRTPFQAQERAILNMIERSRNIYHTI